jgi:hypothetical protein
MKIASSILKLFLTLTLSLLFSVAFASDEKNGVENLERQIEQQILRLAIVHFGSADNVAANVHIILKDLPKKEVSQETLDVGYLPAPVSPKDETSEMIPLEQRIEQVEISMVVSALVTEAAVKSLRNSVQKMFGNLKPNIKVQKVQFTEVVKPKSKDALQPTPTPAPEKDVKNPSENFSRKDLIWCIIVPVSTFSFVMALYFAFSKLSDSISRVSSNLSSSGILIRGTEPKAGSNLNAKDKESGIEKIETHLNDKLNPKDFFESLRKLAETEPVRFISVMSDSPADLIGLRWFLSQLPTEAAETLNKYLGSERLRKVMTPIIAPKDFNMGAWAQDLNERVTLKHLAGRDFLESILSKEDLSYLYQLETDLIFDVSAKENKIEYWKILAELASGDYLLKKAKDLDTHQWTSLMKSGQVSADDMKGKAETFVQLIKSSNAIATTGQKLYDPAFESKVFEPLLQKLQSLPFGEDERFIDEIQADNMRMSEKLRKRFWTFRDLRELDTLSFKSFIDSQTNEVLFSLMFVAPEKDRQHIKDAIPEGMKRSVVLDLLEKAQSKSDEAKLKAAITLTRETLNKALTLHENGKLAKKSDRGIAA